MLDLDSMKNTLDQFQALVEIVQKLRGPNGCPWDKEQTQKSLTQYHLEEAYELIEALETGNQQEIQEELGDFLFQVILQAQVAKDQGLFDLSNVLDRLNKKLVHRHPHVFANAEFKTSEEVWKNWDLLKKQESKKVKPVFSYPRTMPALQAAHKIGVKTESYEFDWTKVSDVFEKVEEEIAELKAILQSNDKKALSHEIGDVLFSMAQLARHLDLEAETCLREANRRFENRFNKVLELAALERDQFAKLSVDQKENFWKKAKQSLSQIENS